MVDHGVFKDYGIVSSKLVNISVGRSCIYWRVTSFVSMVPQVFEITRLEPRDHGACDWLGIHPSEAEVMMMMIIIIIIHFVLAT